MNLVKISVLSLAATLIKMAAGFAINKALAVYVGPAGLAVVGQFQNVIQLLLTLAKGAIDTGVTKYTSEYRDDRARLSRLFSTALRISAVCTIIISLVLVAGAKPLSLYVLHSENYTYVLRLFGLTLFLFVLNSLLLAILNGLQEFRSLITLNITQSVVTAVLAVVLLTTLGLDGALIALVLNQSVVLFVALWKLRNHPVIRLRAFLGPADWAEALRLGRFAIMGLVSAIVSPLSTILVRDHITRSIGLDAAGLWQGVWYVSSVYLTLVTSSLSIYFLPRFSATTNPRVIRGELRAGYMLLVPIVMVCAIGIFLARDLIIHFLFTSEFTPMRDLFAWMLVGDVFKLASWLFSYLMLAKAMMRAYVVTEILFSVSFVILAILMTNSFGLVGVTYAQALNYALYLVAVAVLTRCYWAKPTVNET